MKRLLCVLFGLSVVFAFSAGVLAAAPAGKAKAKPAMGGAVMMPADQMKWVDAVGAPAGVKWVVLWGDPTKGAHGALFKFPAGFSAALHTHSSDLRNVVVSGTVLVGPKGGSEMKLTPGSYAMEPHTFQHTTRCDPASECILFETADGAFDVKMVEEAKGGAMEKKGGAKKKM